MVRPRHAAPESLGYFLRNLGSEAKVMNLVSESVLGLALWYVEIVLQIMHVHLPIAETSPGGNVKVSYDFIDPEAPFNAASLVSLRIELLAVMLTFALFDALTSPESP